MGKKLTEKEIQKRELEVLNQQTDINAEIMEKNPEAYESVLHQEEKFKNS